MIIWRDQPLSNGHPAGPASCKWSSRKTGLLQVIIHHPCHPTHLCQDPNSILRTFLGQLFLFFIDVFTKLRGRQFFFSKVLTKMQVAKEKIVLRDLRGQTLCKRIYLFILEGLERKHCKEIVLWKLLLQWLNTIYKSFSTIIDSDLWIFFFNDWFWFTNHFLQQLIMIYQSFSSMIIIYNDFLQWLITIWHKYIVKKFQDNNILHAMKLFNSRWYFCLNLNH